MVRDYGNCHLKYLEGVGLKTAAKNIASYHFILFLVSNVSIGSMSPPVLTRKVINMLLLNNNKK